MSDFETCLKLHIDSHPLLLPEDVIKFSFQAALGAEHLLSDADKAKKYFDEEYKRVEASDGDIEEYLNEKYCRVNMSVWKKRGYNSERLFEIFLHSAIPPVSREETLLRHLNLADKIVREKGNLFSYPEWTEFLDRYISLGMNPLHHSAQYRSAYSPAYRVVNIKLLDEGELFK